MPSPPGSDSERLMAQIEAYLRTGQGPPAAPEPPRTVRGTVPFEPRKPEAASGGSVHPSGDGSPTLRRPGSMAARLGRPGSMAARLFSALSSLSPQFGRRRSAGPRAGTPASGTPASGRAPRPVSGTPASGRRPRPVSGGADPGAPKWTPLRAVLVGALVVGLLLIPVIWPSQSPGGATGGDHASAAPAGAGYNFLRYNRSGTPVRWDPCTPIQYQLDLDAAPAWAQSDLASAMERISAATGIQFVPAGTTSQFPGSQLPAGSTGAESPVVIAWADPSQSASLNLLSQLTSATPGTPAAAGPAPDVDSLARTIPVAADDQVAGRMVYVSGSVVLSSAAAQLPPGFKAGGEGVLLLHELGRLIGLGDVADGRQVMSSQVLSAEVTDLGPGDRVGLGRLGSGSGCLQVPRNATLQPVL